MERINKYLNVLHEVSKKTKAFYKKHKAGYNPVEDDIMKCNVCGRKADVLVTGSGPLVCCGQPMVKVGEAVDRHHQGETSVARNDVTGRSR